MHLLVIVKGALTVIVPRQLPVDHRGKSAMIKQA
jgi:hypothetical protein